MYYSTQHFNDLICHNKVKKKSKFFFYYNTTLCCFNFKIGLCLKEKREECLLD